MSGLIFIGAAMDSMVRALDVKTGDVLWKALVSAPARRQFDPDAQVSGEIVAFSSPD